MIILFSSLELRQRYAADVDKAKARTTIPAGWSSMYSILHRDRLGSSARWLKLLLAVILTRRNSKSVLPPRLLGSWKHAKYKVVVDGGQCSVGQEVAKRDFVAAIECHGLLSVAGVYARVVFLVVP